MISREVHWRGVVKSFEESGLTQEVFCKSHGIGKSRLQFYLKKFREEAQDSTPKDLFEPLIITPPSRTMMNVKLVVELPNKIRCEFTAIDEKHRMALLKELMTLC